jgi:hypothetical protein
MEHDFSFMPSQRCRLFEYDWASLHSMQNSYKSYFTLMAVIIHPRGPDEPQKSETADSYSTWRIIGIIQAGWVWKKAVFWDVTPCGSCKNRRFEGKCRSLILVALAIVKTRSSHTSIHTAARTLQSHRRDHLRS